MTWRDPPTLRLLDAMRTVDSDLELPVVLKHLVQAAVTLFQAEFGALGVLNASGDGLGEFITVGFDDTVVGADASGSAGLAVLAALLRSPEPLRVLDLAHQKSPPGSGPHAGPGRYPCRLALTH